MGKAAVCFLLAAIASWAQEVSVYSNTFAQYYKADVPGLDRSAFAPLTQFLGIDATGLGLENLSLHMFGWGNFDLAEQTRLGGKNTGSLTYCYVRYRFGQANGEIKAGSFAINHGLGFEQVDGAAGSVDLKGGFTFAAFGGRPVRYSVQDKDQQHDYEYLRDVIFGARLGYRVSKIGDVGISFVQDGTPTSVYDNPGTGGATGNSQPSDYRRRLVGGDFYLVPVAPLSLTGRTVLDVADHTFGGDWGNASRIAENDYSLAYRFTGNFSVRANFAERDFEAYFSGSNMPSLFSALERDKHRSYGGSAAYTNSGSYEAIADYRRIHREAFGDADHFGWELRWINDKAKLVSGLGYHRVNTSEVKHIDPSRPSYSLSHHEFRAWALYDSEKISASLDGVAHFFDDGDNPNLYGQSALYEIVASVALKPTDSLRLSADLACGATAMAKSELRCMARLEYKFGFTGFKGDK